MKINKQLLKNNFRIIQNGLKEYIPQAFINFEFKSLGYSTEIGNLKIYTFNPYYHNSRPKFKTLILKEAKKSYKRLQKTITKRVTRIKNKEDILMKQIKEIFETWFEITMDVQEYHVDFEVNEVTSWTMDDEVAEKEKYVRGLIKWDGCSHVYFGEKGDDGYLHLCGKEQWILHNKLMEHLYDLAKKNMPQYDSGVAE